MQRTLLNYSKSKAAASCIILMWLLMSPTSISASQSKSSKKKKKSQKLPIKQIMATLAALESNQQRLEEKLDSLQLDISTMKENEAVKDRRLVDIEEPGEWENVVPPTLEEDPPSWETPPVPNVDAENTDLSDVDENLPPVILPIPPITLPPFIPIPPITLPPFPPIPPSTSPPSPCQIPTISSCRDIHVRLNDISSKIDESTKAHDDLDEKLTVIIDKIDTLPNLECDSSSTKSSLPPSKMPSILPSPLPSLSPTNKPSTSPSETPTNTAITFTKTRNVTEIGSSLSFIFDNMPYTSSDVAVTFTYSGDIGGGEIKEDVDLYSLNACSQSSSLGKVGEGSTFDQCSNEGNCCTDSKTLIIDKNTFNNLIDSNGQVEFKMILSSGVDTFCDENKGTIAFALLPTSTAVVPSCSPSSMPSITQSARPSASKEPSLAPSNKSSTVPSTSSAPSPQPSPSPSSSCSVIGQSLVVVTIDADNWLFEISWDIVEDCTSTTVALGGDLTNVEINTWSLCLPNGDYTFTIYDSYGDGLSDSDGAFFSVSVDNIEKFKVNGYDFGFSDSQPFTVLNNSLPIAKCPTSSPSASPMITAPTSSPTSSPISFSPSSKPSKIPSTRPSISPSSSSSAPSVLPSTSSKPSMIPPKWELIGSDIDGENEYDFSGESVSLSSDGYTVAIGSPNNDGNGSNTGQVRVYHFDDVKLEWRQRGSDIIGIGICTGSGKSVSLSSDGNIVAIGAPALYCDSNLKPGYVRVYQFDNSTLDWIQRGLAIEGESDEDESGYSVSLSSDGDTVAIGAPKHDANMGNRKDSGLVRVYHFDYTSQHYVQRGSDIDGKSVFEHSGFSVSISSDGDTVAIGAQSAGVNDRHRVQVYRYDDISSDWVQLGSNIEGFRQLYTYTGPSVSLSSDGNNVAVGMPDSNPFDTGYVNVYRYDTFFSSWELLGKSIPGQEKNGKFGSSVSLSSDGSIVAIGAPLESIWLSHSGHVYVYQFNQGTDTWLQVGSRIASEGWGDDSGSSVSLSSDGNIVALGAPKNKGVNGSMSGHVRVYRLSSS